MSNYTPTKISTLSEDEDPKSKPYFYYDNQQLATTHHFYLSDAVEGPSEYVDMIHKIKTAGPNDVVYIYLNTPGGRLDTGVQLLNAMRTTQAKVVTVLESEAHSLGTIIFLSGDEFIVHDDCLMMFHNFSGGTWGKGNEQVAQLEATVKWFEKLIRRIYVPFMSEEEFQKIIDGQDLWLDSDEIRTRLKNMVEIMQAEVDAAEAEAEAAEAKKVSKKKAKKKAKKKTSKKG